MIPPPSPPLHPLVHCCDPQASFRSIEAELTLEEAENSSGTIAPACDRMLEEIGFKPPPLPPSSPAAAQGNNNNDAAPPGDGYTEPTWTREGLGGCPMRKTTTRGGERQSAWAAFVAPVTTMPNLEVRDGAAVSRVIIEGGRAVGVELVEPAPRRWWRGGRRSCSAVGCSGLRRSSCSPAWGPGGTWRRRGFRFWPIYPT